MVSSWARLSPFEHVAAQGYGQAECFHQQPAEDKDTAASWIGKEQQGGNGEEESGRHHQESGKLHGFFLSSLEVSRYSGADGFMGGRPKSISAARGTRGMCFVTVSGRQRTFYEF
jgi:hypothetical protein